MIQIIVCWCIRTKIIQSEIPFDQQKNFNENVDEIFVAPCVKHPLFKDNFDVVAPTHYMIYGVNVQNWVMVDVKIVKQDVI